MINIKHSQTDALRRSSMEGKMLKKLQANIAKITFI